MRTPEEAQMVREYIKNGKGMTFKDYCENQHRQSPEMSLRDAHINQLEAELARYKEQAERIPDICPQKPCYFELSGENRDMDLVMSLARQKCLTICPKWGGGQG